MAFSSIRRKLVLILALLPLVFACSESGTTDKSNKTTEKKEQLSGKELFLQHCAICHGADGKLGASGAKDLTASIKDSLQLTEMIKNGKNGMPAMKDLLETESNIGEVTSYVLKLRN